MAIDPKDHPDKVKALLYKAETRWRTANEKASQSISLQGAHDLIGEALFHPANDDIPGIEIARADYGKKSVKHHNPIASALQGGARDSDIAYTQVFPEGRGTTVRFRPKGLTVGTAVHEGVHLIEATGRVGEAVARQAREGGDLTISNGHNDVFAGNMLRNVHAAVAKDASHALRAHYDALGVPYRTWER